MASQLYTISAANIANLQYGSSTILDLYNNGNPNILSANQLQALHNVYSFANGHTSGVSNFAFNGQLFQDMFTYSTVINGLTVNGPTLTITENQQIAGNLVPIPTGDINAFPVGANTVVFNDAKFVVENPGTQQFFYCDPNNGLSWNVFSVSDAEAVSDNILAVDLLQGEVVVFGSQSIQFFVDTPAAAPVVYQALLGATQDYGLAALYSRAPFMGNIAFLGQNKQGQCQVLMFNGGYQPIPISDQDIDHLINQCVYLSAAIASSYIIDGHPMYELTFPLDNLTLMYDGSAAIWSILQSGIGPRARHDTQFCVTFNYNNFASDFGSGNIYLIDLNNPTENGNLIQRTISTIHLYNDGNMFGIDQVVLDMDTGEGLQTGYGSDPQLVMSVSKDYGRTICAEQWASMGKVGEYLSPRVVYRALGASRDFVLTFDCTAPVPFIIVNGYATLRPGKER